MYRIGEVAKMIQISTSTLRHWEKQGLFKPRRSPTGQRRYVPEDIETIRSFFITKAKTN